MTFVLHAPIMLPHRVYVTGTPFENLRVTYCLRMTLARLTSSLRLTSRDQSEIYLVFTFVLDTRLQPR